MMNNDFWFYTLSTISQTLAAILAVAAVFVVLKLESGARNTNDYRQRALAIIDITRTEKPKADLDILKTLKNLEYRGYEAEIVGLARMYEPRRDFSREEFMENTINNLQRYISQNQKVVNLIKVPGLFTFLTIGLSIILLTASNFFLMSSQAMFVLVFIASFALTSLWLILSASWNILRDFF